MRSDELERPCNHSGENNMKKYIFALLLFVPSAEAQVGCFVTFDNPTQCAEAKLACTFNRQNDTFLYGTHIGELCDRLREQAFLTDLCNGDYNEVVGLYNECAGEYNDLLRAFRRVKRKLRAARRGRR